ncbi:MAG: carboxypeptidase regulatory-like domain-containing protein [Lentimicrobium sp.]|nr:carboxypeptidase regulatory-like domain-containing protein [Lentimicrobium sp.]
MNKKFLILLLAMSPLLGLFAQTGTLLGRVTDAESGRPLPSVTVKVATQQTFTDSEGQFSLSGVATGEIVVEFLFSGYENISQVVNVGETTNLGTIKMTPSYLNDLMSGGLSEISISSDSDDDSKAQNISGLLSSSNDIFVSTASYTFGPAYFRMRGYDNDLGSTYIGNTPISDVETGRTTWALWGGLNDATRNKVSVNGLSPASFSFGNLGGVTNIITRASQHRAQTKLTYSMTNRTYTNRVMFTHSTGMMDNGWAITASGSRRWGQEGFVEGTYYDAWAGFLGIERKLNNTHSLAFTAFVAPVKRGMQGGSTQEAYDLTGNNYYNPNWGYQNGEKRNARERIMNQPVIILNHYWNPSNKTQITSSASYLFGQTGTTALNWYNASDPRPDYYRYLPSYFPTEGDDNTVTYYTPEIAQKLTEGWQNDNNVRQVNWDKLYQINYLSNIEGKQARYMIENRHNDQNQLNITSFINHEINDKIRIDGGIEYNSNTGTFYKTVQDLLGGEFWTDIDQFAERDFSGNDTISQNDLNNPNRIVKEGDKFGYEYKLKQNSGNIWTVANFSSLKVDYYAGIQLSYTSFWREGLMRNGRYPESSFGVGEKHNFFDYALKAGATYKITGRHFIEGNATAMTRAPYIRNSYLSSRVRDAVIPDLKSENILSGELSYHLRAPMIKARITVYNTLFQNANEINSFYHDSLRTFVNHAMYNINKVHQGIEAGAEVKLTSAFAVVAAANLGNYRYTNRSTASITVENGSVPDITKTIFNKYFYISGTPQTAASVGLKYMGPGFLFIDMNVNYYDNIYLDFNPERRTSTALSGMGTDDARIPGIINQEKLPSGMTLDASIGKSFRIMRKYYLNLNFSISNILDNQGIITGGYEQMRFDFEKKNINKFPPKYFYYYGRTFFLNIGFRF